MLKSLTNLNRQFENCVALRSLSTTHHDIPFNTDACFLILDRRPMYFRLQVRQTGNVNYLEKMTWCFYLIFKKGR